MARKLNRKFVFVVGGVSLAALVLVGSVAFWRVSSAPERNIALGDAALAAGKINEAVDRYGRAANKRPDRTDFWEKYVVGLRAQKTNTSIAGNANYLQLLSALSKLAESDPQNVEALRAYLDLLMFVPPTEIVNGASRLAPKAAAFPKQRAMIEAAQLTGRLRQWETSRSGLDEAERKLLEVARTPETVPEAWYGLIEYAEERASAARRANLSADIARWNELLDGYLAQAIGAFPESARLLTMAAIKAQIADRAQGLRGADASAPPLIDQAVAVAANQAKTIGLLEAMALVRMASAASPVQRARVAEVVQDWMASHDDHGLVAVELAALLRQSDVPADREEAMAIDKAVRDTREYVPGVSARMQDALRVSAARAVFDDEFIVHSAAVPEARAEAAKQLDAALEALRRVAGSSSEGAIARCEALLQYSRGQFGPALKGLERAVQADDSDTLAMIVAMNCAGQRQELGVASRFASQAVARFPGNPRVIEAALNVALGVGKTQEARALADRLVTLEPDHAIAKSVLSAVDDPASIPAPSDELDALLRKAFQDSKGDPRAMRDLAAVLVAEHPTDVRPRLMWVEAISRTGDREATIKANDESLVLFPDNDILKNRKLALSTTDPVERVRLMAAQENRTPDEQLVFQLTTLLASEPAFESEAASSNDAEVRARAAKDLATISAELVRLTPQALALKGEHEDLFILLVERASRKGDQAALDQVLTAARVSMDEGGVTLLRAIAALRAGQPQQAIELMKREAESTTADALALRLLGEAYMGVGAPDRAVEYLRRAFERQPTNGATARLYTDALMASGDARKALGLLGEAAAARPGDRAMRDQWLTAESRFGDRGLALVERRRQVKRAPDDFLNFRSLATLLLELNPDATTILDEQFRPKYTAGQWQAMPVATREETIRKEREQNVAEARLILNALRGADPNDLDALLLEVRGLTAIGATTGADQALTAADSTVTRGRPMLFLIEAEHFARAGKPELMDRALDEAVKAGGGEPSTARAVARLRASRGELDRALKAMEPLLGAGATNQDLRECARWAAALRQQDRALELLDRIQDGSDRKQQFETTLARGIIALERMVASQEKGDRAGMDAAFADIQARITAAAALDSRSTAPQLTMATVALQMFQRTGDKSFLEVGLKAIAEAQQREQLNVALARLRWQLLEAKGDREAAVREARRILAVVPTDGALRMELVELLLRASDSVGARATLEEAVRQSALNGVWLRRLAKIQSEAGEWTEAGQSYERAFASDLSVGSLELAARMYLSKDPPDLRSLSGLLRNYPEQTRSSLYLQSARSAGEALSGAREAGLVNLRSIYQANASAGAGKQAVDGWWDILRQVFKIEQSQAELQAFDEYVRQVADVNDPETLRQLSESWILFKNAPPEMLAKAKQYAEQSLAAAGTDKRAIGMGRMALGNVLYRMGDCAGASKEFQSVLEIYPTQFNAVNNVAYVEATCGDAKRALEFARRAAALDPLNVDGIDTLGLAMLKNGDAAGAESTLLRGIESRATPALLLHLAMAQEAQQKRDAAKASLKRFFDLAKANPLPESEAALAAQLEGRLK